MKALKPHIAFMSCEPSDEKSLESTLRQQGLGYKKGLGSYQGVEETSYMITLSTDIMQATLKLEKVFKLGRAYAQESILYCDNERTAYLLFCDDSAAPRLGTLTPIENKKALGENWSYFDGIYWEVK